MERDKMKRTTATEERYGTEEKNVTERGAPDASETRSLAGINFILGVWLIISPWVLNYATADAKWDSFAAGIAITVLSLIRYAVPRAAWASWLNGLIGIWMIVAPFVLNYSRTAAFWNEIIVGIVIAVLALANLQSYSRYDRTTV